MARLPIDKARLNRLAGRSVARYIDFVHRSSRLIIEPANPEAYLAANQPAIIAAWHGQFLLSPPLMPPRLPFAVMLARHGDAELFAAALSRFNSSLIRGAGAGARKKDRGGASALRAAIKQLQQNVFVAMTADVPPGPARRAGEGIVALARLSGRPIIPFAAATSRYRALNTWSRMTINLPYGTLASVFGEPIFVPRDADAAMLEASRRAVENGLNLVTARAYHLAGADPARATPTGALPLPANDVRAGRTIKPAAPKIPSSLGLKTYSMATRMLEPAAPLLLASRARRGKEDIARHRERLGFASRPRPQGRVAWIHAASVGELNSVLPLADLLRAGEPGLSVVFTTGTVTSATIADRRLSPRDIHQYMPLDSVRFVGRFLDHWQPDVAVLTESEIWPNMLRQISVRHIPLTLINARMSERSHKRWRGLPSVAQPLFSRFDLVLAQNESIAARFREVGARHVIAVGNLKIDAPPPAVNQVEFERLRAALAGRLVLIAASTHDGEERMLADAHKIVARERPGLCTIVVPRHPERGTEIAEMLKSRGISVAQRSLGVMPSSTTDVYVADTIGELGTFYALGPVSFIGGSLVERGGQNPIEAVRLGSVVVSGPHTRNFTDAYDALIAHNAARIVPDAGSLAAAIAGLIGNPAEQQRMQARANAALATLAGALERTAQHVRGLMAEPAELARVD